VIVAHAKKVSRAKGRTGTRRRLLILGPVNSPHTEHLAAGAQERDFDVAVAGTVWPALPITETLERRNIDVSLREWPTARWLRDLMRRVQPDVVHANWLTDAFLYLVYGAVPMVAMAWGSDVYRASRREDLQNRLIARRAAMLLADSGHLLQRLRELGAPEDRTTLINWGIDLQEFSPPAGDRAATRRALGLPEGRLILSPRSLRPIYNPRTIVAAFEVVAADDADVHLLLKHIHEDEPDLGPLRYPDRVHTIGYVPYEQMADYYRAADVCLSIPSSDSSPRSVWEAMGCGTPCVLSDLPWVHELIHDGREALVVPPDSQSVANAVVRLLGQQGLREEIAAGGRRLVELHRDRDAELDRLTEVYERVARERTGASAGSKLLHSGIAAAATGVAVARRRLASRDDR
jgi:glycosyltransferase involved in cell wall biosynthesis